VSLASTDQRQSIIGISLLVKLIESYGVSSESILSQAGIEVALLDDPKATISVQQDIDFTQAMMNAIDDPQLAFKAGQAFRINAFGAIGLAASACGTVEEAINFFLKYIRLSYTLFDIEFIKQEEISVLRFNDFYPLEKHLKRFYLERDFAFFMISIRDVFPRSSTGSLYKSIRFDFSPEDSAGKSAGDYLRCYECEVIFTQPQNDLLFDSRYLNRSLPHANALTQKLLEEQCEMQKAELVISGLFADKVRQIVRTTEGVIPKLEDIAAQLNMTRRTATRKLQAEGISFQEIVSEESSRKAIHYLQTTQLTVEQIADKLGYSESAGFTRAFKRWTGKVPKEYR